MQRRRPTRPALVAHRLLIILARDGRMNGREKRFLFRFLIGEAVAVLGFATIYFTFPRAPAVVTVLGVVLSFLGAEVATFTVYGCVSRLRRDSLQGIFALFGVVGWLFFPYVFYRVGLVVGMGPDFSSFGGSPGLDGYDVAGIILWIAGGSVLFAWPASLILAVQHRKYYGA